MWPWAGFPVPHFLPNKAPSPGGVFERGLAPRRSGRGVTFPSSLGKAAGFFRLPAPNDHLNPISRAGRAGGCRGSPPTSAAATSASLGLSPPRALLSPQRAETELRAPRGPQVPPPGVWGPWGDAGFLCGHLGMRSPLSEEFRADVTLGEDTGAGGHGGTSQWGQGDTQ